VVTVGIRNQAHGKSMIVHRSSSPLWPASAACLPDLASEATSFFLSLRRISPKLSFDALVSEQKAGRWKEGGRRGCAREVPDGRLCVVLMAAEFPTGCSLICLLCSADAVAILRARLRSFWQHTDSRQNSFAAMVRTPAAACCTRLLCLPLSLLLWPACSRDSCGFLPSGSGSAPAQARDSRVNSETG
jgi:hypothetical protein